MIRTRVYGRPLVQVVSVSSSSAASSSCNQSIRRVTLSRNGTILSSTSSSFVSSSSSSSSYLTSTSPSRSYHCICSSLPTSSSSSSSSSSLSSPTSPFSSPLSPPRRSASSTASTRRAKIEKRIIAEYAFNPFDYKIAIFGRPNVGKSTLFNRLVGKSMAIVDKLPGVTRDRRDGNGQIGELEFALCDTAGLEEIQKFLMKDKHEYQLINNEPMNQDLQESIIQQTENAIQECDVALFVIDGREGVTSLDRFFGKWLRRQCTTIKRVVDPITGAISHVSHSKPVILLANKCDHAEHEHRYHGLIEGYELGFGEPHAISADHASGMSGLHNAIHDAFSTLHSEKAAAFPAREKRINEDLANIANIRTIKMAIVGKVNVGKSTLINTLLGNRRVLTGSQPGVTRDAIEIDWRDEGEEKREKKMKEKEEERRKEQQQQDGKAPSNSDVDDVDINDNTAASSSTPLPSSLPSYRFTLVDTAGLKGVTTHSHSQYSRVDALSMQWSLRSIERANVVALMIDIAEAKMEGVDTQAEVNKQAETDAAEVKQRNKRGEGKHSKNKASSSSSSTTPSSTSLEPTTSLSPSLLFKSDRNYTETERGFLLRTYVRNLFTAGDLAIAAKVLNEGRAIIILLNKFDLVPTIELRNQILEGVAEQLTGMMPMAGAGVTVLGISGSNPYDPLRGQQLKTTIRTAAIDVYDRWSSRIATHRLNLWLIELLKFHPPPSASPRVGGSSGGPVRRVAFKFIQQISVGPPTFALFANGPAKEIGEDYKKFLVNSLRKEFGLGGIPVRLYIRVRENPYLDAGKKEEMRAKKRKKDEASAQKEATDVVKETKTNIDTVSTLTKFSDDTLEADYSDVDSDSVTIDGKFNISDYKLDDDEVKFDYDSSMKSSLASSSSVDMHSVEVREEIKRERRKEKEMEIERTKKMAKEAKSASSAASSSDSSSSTTSTIPKVMKKMDSATTFASLARKATAASILDRPIPRLTTVKDATAAAASAASISRSTRSSSSSALSSLPLVPIHPPSPSFVSTLRVSKPRRAVTSAFAWSLHTPKAGSGARKNRLVGANGWTPNGGASAGAGRASTSDSKTFGTRRAKVKKMNTSGMQSPQVAKAIAKVDMREKQRKDTTIKRKAEKTARKQAAKKAK